jgi:acetyl-CoA C-acetyltransferase
MSVYILSGKRTPLGSLMGTLSTITAPQLGAAAIKAAIANSGVAIDKVNEVVMGHVVQAGTGQAPARQAAIFSGLSESVAAVTINKVCGSGLQAIIYAGQSILLNENEVVVCGGMENMSLAPHLIPTMRQGVKFGKTEIKDSMQWDGLWDVYSNQVMGNCAEACAKKFQFSRQAQDEFAITSFKRSQEAIKNGTFKSEITAISIENPKGPILVEIDEGPMKAQFDKIPKLKPAFDPNGSITAANASTINDGAAALVLAGEKYKSQARFKIVAHAVHAQNPTWFTTAPVEAMKKCLKKANMSVKDIDLFEINEAFAVVPMAAMKELNLSHEIVNVYGGAISLGHPLGCSGARIIVTLMNSLERYNKKTGMASLCIGGGEGLAMIIQRL